MTANDVIKLIQKSGTRVSKDKLAEIIKRVRDKDFAYIDDRATGQIVVLIKQS